MSKPIQSVKASFVAVWLWTLTPTNDPLFLALAMLLSKRREKKKEELLAYSKEGCETRNPQFVS